MTHHCRAIDPAAQIRLYKEIGECRNEWGAVAEKDVSPLEQTELLRIISSEKCQVYIARHGEGP